MSDTISTAEYQAASRPRSVLGALICLQAIADATNGRNLNRALGTVELLPQVADVHVDDVGVRGEAVAEHALQDHGARDDVPAIAQEQRQQRKLLLRQLELGA